MENIVQWLKMSVKYSFTWWYFQNSQTHTYVIIIAIVKRKNVVSRLSSDVINFRTFLVC